MEPEASSSAHVLSDDQIRDQMAAHVHDSKLRFTSWASIQLYIFFFVAYCSKLNFWVQLFHLSVSNSVKIPGERDSIVP